MRNIFKKLMEFNISFICCEQITHSKSTMQYFAGETFRRRLASVYLEIKRYLNINNVGSIRFSRTREGYHKIETNAWSQIIRENLRMIKSSAILSVKSKQLKPTTRDIQSIEELSKPYQTNHQCRGPSIPHTWTEALILKWY